MSKTNRLVFPTYEDAEKSGYVRQREALIERYQDGEIRVVDNSGYSEFGYEYALRAYSPPNFLGDPGNCLGSFAKTHTVYLSEEKNSLGVPGVYVPMFYHPEWEEGIVAARKAIDQYTESQIEKRQDEENRMGRLGED